MIARSGFSGITAACLAVAAGCGDAGEFAPTGAHEPIVVHYQRHSVDRGRQEAMFFSGSLPTGSDGPSVGNVLNMDQFLSQGQAGKTFSGAADLGTTAVALRLEDVGTGYWVVPVDNLDLTDPSEVRVGWSATVDFSFDLAPGVHELVASAANADGEFGPKSSPLPLTIAPYPPAAPLVVSLKWNTNADLDLHLIMPSGKEVDSKHVTSQLDPSSITAPVCGSTGLLQGTGILDRDADANCGPEALHEENVVFCGPPPSGPYLVRVDMFSACGEAYADFTVRLLQNGTALAEPTAGHLLAIDADGGGPGSGLAVMNFFVP